MTWTRLINIVELSFRDMIEIFNEPEMVLVHDISRILHENGLPLFTPYPGSDEIELEIPDREEEVIVLQNVNDRLYYETMTIRRLENDKYGWIETEKLG